MTLFFLKKMDTVALLLARDQVNSQNFRNRIQHYRQEIQHFRGLIGESQEHIRELYEEFHDETTTPARRDSILRKETRTQQGIALLQNLISLKEEDIRMEEENQRRRHAEIMNVVNHFLYRRHVA